MIAKEGKKLNQDFKVLMEELYPLYEQKMYAAAYGILHHSQQAEDAVQDAFVKLTKYLHKIKQPDSEETRRLIMRILKTTAIDQYRKNHRENERLEVADFAVHKKEMMIFPMQNVEDKMLLQRLLFELPAEYLDVIKLRCYYEFSNRETSKILNISIDAVAKRLERAKKLIQKNIESEGLENEKKKK